MYRCTLKLIIYHQYVHLLHYLLSMLLVGLPGSNAMCIGKLLMLNSDGPEYE